jgi:hypothetical protein
VNRRIFRVVVDVETDTDAHDDPGTWNWSELLDAPTVVVDIDEVAPVPAI